MKAYFTARHRDALEAKRVHVTFSRPLRVSVERILYRFSNWDGYNQEENCSYEAAEDKLRTFYGQRSLRAYKDKVLAEGANFGEVIENGYPGHVLDAIEAWFDTGPAKAREAEFELNDLFNINRSPWRIVNGNSILVDSQYLHEEIIAKTFLLMTEGAVAGAQDEFQTAVAALQQGEHKRSVTEAHKSVESVMKTVLGVRDHQTFGSLLSKLLKSGTVPEYYREFLLHFEKIMLGAVKERNQPGTGHGQGTDLREVDRSLAQFAVHLAGAVNHFLLERWLEARRDAAEKAELPNDDIPF